MICKKFNNFIFFYFYSMSAVFPKINENWIHYGISKLPVKNIDENETSIEEIEDCEAEIIEDVERPENPSLEKQPEFAGSELAEINKQIQEFVAKMNQAPKIEGEKNENGEKIKIWEGRAFHIVVHQKIKDKLNTILDTLQNFQQFQYILAGMHKKEKDKNGQEKPPHVHIYVQFRNSEKINNKMLFGAHVGKCRASAKLNIQYIKCKDDHERHKHVKYIKVYEAGFPKYRGGHISKRDIIERYLENNKSINELDYRYYNVVKKIIDDYERETEFARWRQNVLKGKKSIEVEWHVGKGGTGKTYTAAMKSTDNDAIIDFTKDGQFANVLGDVKHAETIIINEFKDSTIDFKTFLALLVNEKVINIKGSQVYPQNLKHVIITSQQYPHEIYKTAGEDRTQISRRIDSIYVHNENYQFIKLDNEKYWNNPYLLNKA